MDDPTGALEGVKGNIETGFGKPTCSYLGRFGREKRADLHERRDEARHAAARDSFPICDGHFEEFKDDYPMVVVQEL